MMILNLETKIMTYDPNLTYCAICNKKMKIVTRTHLNTHNTNLAEYKEKYPDVSLVSENQRLRASSHAIKINKPGVPRPGVGEKISATKQQRKAEGFDYGAKIRGIPKSEEHNQKVSNAIKESYASGNTIHWNLGGILSKEHRLKISDTCKLYKLSDEQKANHKLAMQRFVNSPGYINAMRGKSHSAITKRKISNKVNAKKNHIRSKMESKGKWITLDKINDLTKYKRLVWSITKQVEHLIPGYDRSKRGVCKHGTDHYQIDHILSITDGFKQGIPPSIIGSLKNLRFIPWKDNLAKFSTSHISLNELQNI